jgi:sorbose reductase
MSMSIEDAGVVREPKPVPNISESVFAQFRMDGKVVAITGGADGLGLAAAEAMAEAGANIALWYNSNPAAIERSKDLEAKFGIKSKAYQVGVSNHKAVEQAMAKVVEDFGKLDVFCANAGMAISKAITEQTVEEYRKQMSVNRKSGQNSKMRSLN